jgi:hypothetical protein
MLVFDSMRVKKIFIWILASFLLSSCFERMEAVSNIRKFRVMAVQADPPEMQPGEGTTLRVLYADPFGGDRSIVVLWIAFMGSFSSLSDFEGASFISLPFLEPKFATIEEGGGEYVIDGGSTENALTHEYFEDYWVEKSDGNNSVVSRYLPVTTVVFLCAGGTIPDQSRFTEGEEIVFRVEMLGGLCEGGESVISIKTFRISHAPDPNRNPRIERVEFNDQSVYSDAGVDDRDADGGIIFAGEKNVTNIEAYLTADSFQGDDDTYEDLYISWFVTNGEVGDGDRVRINDDDKSKSDYPNEWPFKNKWKLSYYPSRSDLWLVAHDLRGGTSWEHYQVKSESQTTREVIRVP